MTNKTEITIENDCIIYNGVKYEKVKTVPSEQPFKLQFMFADILENEITNFRNYDDVMCNVDVIATTLLEEMSRYIPDYSDWEDALKEVADEKLPQEKQLMFRQGWNAYCKKMWDMINETD